LIYIWVWTARYLPQLDNRWTYVGEGIYAVVAGDKVSVYVGRRLSINNISACGSKKGRVSASGQTMTSTSDGSHVPECLWFI